MAGAALRASPVPQPELGEGIGGIGIRAVVIEGDVRDGVNLVGGPSGALGAAQTGAAVFGVEVQDALALVLKVTDVLAVLADGGAVLGHGATTGADLVNPLFEETPFGGDALVIDDGGPFLRAALELAQDADGAGDLAEGLLGALTGEAAPEFGGRRGGPWLVFDVNAEMRHEGNGARGWLEGMLARAKALPIGHRRDPAGEEGGRPVRNWAASRRARAAAGWEQTTAE